MGTRRKYKRTGLLTTALLLMSSLCFAEDPRVLMYSSPDRPVAESTWTLSLMIAHHEPDEVDVRAPHFTGSLMLDQVNRILRMVNPVTGQVHTGHSGEYIPASFERWTVMEYRFLLSSPGTISFDAFTIITPLGQTETAPFDIRVRRPQDTAEVQNFRLRWEGIPSSLKIGQNVVFDLRIIGWSPVSPLPPEAELFLPPVLPGYILESIPLAPEERSGGIALKLKLIPLEKGFFIIEKHQVTHNGNVFEIPALRIPVAQTENSNDAITGESSSQNNNPPLPFPVLAGSAKIHSSLYQKHQSECETIYAAAKILWDGGNCAGALAALRQKERDHPAGAIFASLRRGAEAALGLSGTNDEKKPLLPFLKDKNRRAVLIETAIRQIPDSAGIEITRLREGQPVLLNGTPHKNWLRVITNDDNEISGWVPEEKIIFY